jgi:predicted DNA-binding transcriptional regulator YafY
MRADRLISIIMHLQNRGRMTAKELAQCLEVSERTIYRDMDALSNAGVPVYSDGGHGGGFSLPKEYRTKVDGLTTAEIHALFLQLNGQPAQHLGIGQPYQSAMMKLMNGLSEQHRKDADWIRQRVHLDMDSWSQEPELGGLLDMVQQSVHDQRQAILSYTNRNHESVEGMVQPYGLVLKGGMWFLVGFAWDQIRTFRVSRIHSYTMTDQQFERPADFQLEAYWREWTSKVLARRLN